MKQADDGLLLRCARIGERPAQGCDPLVARVLLPLAQGALG
jgi:hypothetical protein